MQAATWALWGKTDRAADSGAWHPLICHMLDVGAVAEALLDGHVSAAVVRAFAAQLELTEHDFRRLVVALVALHDLGKATPAFQAKWPPGKQRLIEAGLPFPKFGADVPHGHLTAGELAIVLEGHGVPWGFAIQAARWVGAHHGEFPSDSQVERSQSAAGVGRWAELRGELAAAVFDTLGAGAAVPLTTSAIPDLGLWLAGLTSAADWLGSMAEVFGYASGPVTNLGEYLERTRGRARDVLSLTSWQRWSPGEPRTFSELFGFAPRPLQEEAIRIAARAEAQVFAIVEAPMGEGKTEAALWLAHELGRRLGHEGLYVALPTMATANQMHRRVARFLETSYPGRYTLQLLHGGAALAPPAPRLSSIGEDPVGHAVAGEWFTKSKRGFLSTFSVGTIDQALLGVMRTRHFFVRLFGLSGKTVVLDEVHAYDAYTSRLLDRLVAWLRRLGASVVVLSATLPASRRRELLAAWGAETQAPPPPYPRVLSATGSAVESVPLIAGSPKSIEVEWVGGDAQAALEWLTSRVRGGGCAGWICSTVRRAQEAFRLARDAKQDGRLPADLAVLLVHSKFTPADRARLEARLLSMLGKPGADVARPRAALVVGTQVLEQSLDIDFDVMATDLAPVDLLLQRTGRVWRHERSRPAGIRSPVLGVLRLEGEDQPKGPALEPHSYVYDEAVLLRSWLALHARGAIELPSDIERLVELVYDGRPELAASPELRARVEEAARRLEADLALDTSTAEGRLLEPPGAPDDPLASFDFSLDDEDDPSVHRALRAETRLGDPSVSVVLLEARGGQLFVPGHDAAIDLSREPSLVEARALARSALSLSNRKLLGALPPVPDTWKRSSFLRRHRALVLTAGRATVGATPVRYDEEQGFVIETSDGGSTA